MANLKGKDFLPDVSSLRLRGIEQGSDSWVVEASASSVSACPDCGVSSTARHSSYWRQLKDLPIQGRSVRLKLRVGRWRCRNPICKRKIFCQRLPGVTGKRAQETDRFAEILRSVGYALGGRAGERLSVRLGLRISDDTLLRRVKEAAKDAPPLQAIRAIGVDDWAWSKGKNFGSIVVDLERGTAVDVLPLRSAKALSEWLERHPGVSVVARDRQGLYAEGARRGAPDAVQVADRFHLIQNLRQAVERALAVQRSHLRLPARVQDVLIPPSLPVKGGHRILVRSRVAQMEAETVRQRRQERLKLFQTVKEMQAAGLRISEIARHLGVNRRRLDKWARLDTLPERDRMQPRPGMAESFRDYLRRRWEQGCRHGRTLLAEIRQLGYIGGHSQLAKLLSPWRQPPAGTNPAAEDMTEERSISVPGRSIAPQVAAALLSKIPSELTDHQAEIVSTLKKQCPGFAAMRKLVLSFRSILRRGKVGTLKRSIKEAENAGITAITRFVRHLKRDQAAVENAVVYGWSNGPVEGHINRLKAVKRQMYGRAGFELLRSRVLPLAA